MALKRYEIGRYNFGVPIESPTGQWVRYSDYKGLENHCKGLAEKNAILLSELREQRKDDGWYK